MFFSIILMVIGVLIFYITVKDEKNRERNLTVSYIMHIKGYIGGIGVFLLGLLMLINYILKT